MVFAKGMHLKCMCHKLTLWQSSMIDLDLTYNCYGRREGWTTSSDEKGLWEIHIFSSNGGQSRTERPRRQGANYNC